MTRRDYILNTFANKLAKDPVVKAPAPAPAPKPAPKAPVVDAVAKQNDLDAQQTEDAFAADQAQANAQSMASASPMSLRDRISKHLGAAQGYVTDNPTVSAAVGGGALTALLAAVMSKKGKRLRHAAVGAGVGAGAGVGVAQGYGPLTERIKAKLAERKTAKV